MQKQADSVVQVRTFINFRTFFDTRRETQFLKVFCNQTMQTKFKLPGRTSSSQHHGLNSTSTLDSMTENSILNTTMAETKLSVNSKLTCFSKSPNSLPIASGHDVIHTPVPFRIWGLVWQLWLSYPLRASAKLYPMLCTWTKSQIVQSPTKLNDKI